MSTNAVSQKTKNNTLKKLQKTTHKLSSPRYKEANVNIGKKYEPSMEREVRFHLVLSKHNAEKMEHPLSFC